MKQNITICWMRQDLRLSDNPALYEAAQNGKVLPVYIIDSNNHNQIGAASNCWLHHSLESLNHSLDGKLSIYLGDPEKALKDLAHRYQVKSVYWNHCYEPSSIARDNLIKKHLQENGITVNTYNGSLLCEPWEIKNNEGGPYKVFSHFYRKVSQQEFRKVLDSPSTDNFLYDTQKSLSLDDLKLLPKINWYEKLLSNWKIGEAAANECLNDFIQNKITNYKKARDYPARLSTSYLSPYLHFGEISPQQVWNAVQKNKQGDGETCFLSELGWREFSYHLLYHYPNLPSANLQNKFHNFPWQDNDILLKKWQTGQTGYPIVDAGMRELWQTGYMHNRVRMIVASFLVKNLLIDWRHGAKWFWNCLLDADLANNSASWQWVAGCGADASPYFRIFNPILQSKKFDPDGNYIRLYLPELSHIPNKYLFSPWEAPKIILNDIGVTLGVNYPYPIVDLKTSRDRALKAFANL